MKILIIRLSSIGDVILTTPVARCLKKSLNARIDFVTDEINLPILRHNPYISSVILPDQLSQYNLNQYDHIIDLNNSRKSRATHEGQHKSLIKTDKMPIRKWLMLILKINLLNKSHTVDRHFAAVEGLGVDNDGVGLDLFLDDQVDLPVSEDISDHIVINAGASKVTKRVPRALIEGIIKSSKRKYMLIGGKDVAEEYKGFDKTNCINLIDQLSLEQSFRIISECHLLITGDTAMMHAAAALQKPQIVVWGSTSDDFGFYPYYGCDRTDLSHHIIKGLDCQPCSKMGRVSCPKGHMNCLTNIEAKEVLLKIKKITSD